MAGSPKIGPNRGNAGKGRPKGSPNKITRTVKEAVEAAFSEVGAEQWLIEQAKTNPQAFMALISRLLPAEVRASVSGSLSLERVTIHNALPWDSEHLEYYGGLHDETLLLDGSGKPIGILIPLDAPELAPLP